VVCVCVCVCLIIHKVLSLFFSFIFFTQLIYKQGKFRLNAPSLCNRNNICSMKFRGVTPGETMYWHDKIKKCLKRHSSLVVRGVSMEISNSLRHVASVETIGSVETDSEEEKEEEEDVEDDKEKDVDFLTFQFGAENLRNRDGHGIKAFGISDPYFEVRCFFSVCIDYDITLSLSLSRS